MYKGEFTARNLENKALHQQYIQNCVGQRGTPTSRGARLFWDSKRRGPIKKR